MKTLIVITSYNRKDSLRKLVDNLLAEENCDIVIFDDHSKDRPSFKGKQNVRVVVNPEHRGKTGFWQTYNDIFDYCKKYHYDYYIILPDDVEPCPNFVEVAIEAYNRSGFICLSPFLTNRSILAGVSRWGGKPIREREGFYETGYFDCCGIMKSDFFECLNWHMLPIAPSTNPFRSSGVGRQITTRLQAAGKRMGHVKRTMLATTDDPSAMNAEERKRHPIYANWRDNEGCVDVHMASLWRDGHVVKTADTLMKQPELSSLFVTLNNYSDEQYKKVDAEFKKMSAAYGKRIVTRRCDNRKGSNEKLGMLTRGTSRYFAFADDDILYPADYLLRLIHGCNIHNAAVSLHGGILRQFPLRHYYNGGRSMKSRNITIESDTRVDILGTGFGLLKREWFTNDELKKIYATAPETSMDDIILSCYLANKGIDRWVLEHAGRCIAIKRPAAGDGYVFNKYKDNDSEQVKYINANYPTSALVKKLRK